MWFLFFVFYLTQNFLTSWQKKSVVKQIHMGHWQQKKPDFLALQTETEMFFLMIHSALSFAGSTSHTETPAESMNAELFKRTSHLILYTLVLPKLCHTHLIHWRSPTLLQTGQSYRCNATLTTCTCTGIVNMHYFAWNYICVYFFPLPSLVSQTVPALFLPLYSLLFNPYSISLCLFLMCVFVKSAEKISEMTDLRLNPC